jgi:hypothetical protein
MSEGLTKMESSHKAGIVKPSEWTLLLFATVLLGAAVSSQQPDVPTAAGPAAVVPVEAKIDIPADESVPVILDSKALFEKALFEKTPFKKAPFEIEDVSETQVAAVMIETDTPALVQNVVNAAANDIAGNTVAATTVVESEANGTNQE